MKRLGWTKEQISYAVEGMFLKPNTVSYLEDYFVHQKDSKYLSKKYGISETAIRVALKRFSEKFEEKLENDGVISMHVMIPKSHVSKFRKLEREAMNEL